MDKVLSDKQLLRKASSKIAAAAFLAQYQEHIRENFPETTDLLDRYTKGEAMPTPTVEVIKNVVAAHILENMKKTAEEAIAKAIHSSKAPKKKSGTTGSGRYAIQFFVKNVTERTGEASIDLYSDENAVHTHHAETFHAAQNIVDRKLSNLMHSVYAEIVNKFGIVIKTTITRDDALSRYMKQRKGPACRDRGQGLGASMKPVMSCKQDTSSFSRG